MFTFLLTNSVTICVFECEGFLLQGPTLPVGQVPKFLSCQTASVFLSTHYVLGISFWHREFQLLWDPLKMKLSSGGWAPFSTDFSYEVSVLGTLLYQCTSWCYCERQHLDSGNLF